MATDSTVQLTKLLKLRQATFRGPIKSVSGITHIGPEMKDFSLVYDTKLRCIRIMGTRVEKPVRVPIEQVESYILAEEPSP